MSALLACTAAGSLLGPPGCVGHYDYNAVDPDRDFERDRYECTLKARLENDSWPFDDAGIIRECLENRGWRKAPEEP